MNDTVTTTRHQKEVVKSKESDKAGSLEKSEEGKRFIKGAVQIASNAGDTNRAIQAETQGSKYIVENLTSAEVTNELTRGISDFFRYIFCNSFPEYVVCLDCDVHLSAPDAFDTGGEYICIADLDSRETPCCPDCQNEMELFLDPKVTIEKLEEKFKDNACITLLRNKESGDIEGFTFGYFCTLREQFDREWKNQYLYKERKDSEFDRSFDEFIHTLNAVPGVSQVTSETPVFGWNCVATSPNFRSLDNFLELMRNFFALAKKENPNQGSNPIIVSETLKGSTAHRLFKAGGYIDIPGFLSGDYGLVIGLLQELHDNYQLKQKQFIRKVREKSGDKHLKYLEHPLDNPKIKLKEVLGKGRGVFAIEDISKGEAVAEFDGPVYEADKISDLDPYIRDHAIQIDERKYLYGKDGLAELINHSCDPNCGIHGISKVVAMRDIQAGEEITWDYEMTEDSDWKMENCECGSEDCRGTIRAFRYLPEEKRARYSGYISSWLVDKYLS